MAARARWIMFRDQLRFYLAAEQAAILGDQATMMVGEQSDDDGLRAVVAQLEAAEPVRPLVVGDAVDADLEASRPP